LSERDFFVHAIKRNKSKLSIKRNKKVPMKLVWNYRDSLSILLCGVVSLSDMPRASLHMGNIIGQLYSTFMHSGLEKAKVIGKKVELKFD